MSYDESNARGAVRGRPRLGCLGRHTNPCVHFVVSPALPLPHTPRPPPQHPLPHLEYRAELHDLHNDYPLAPEQKLVTQDMLSPYAAELKQQLKVSATKIRSGHCESPKRRHTKEDEDGLPILVVSGGRAAPRRAARARERMRLAPWPAGCAPAAWQGWLGEARAKLEANSSVVASSKSSGSLDAEGGEGDRGGEERRGKERAGSDGGEGLVARRDELA